MGTKPRWYELVERSKNFYGEYKHFYQQILDDNNEDNSLFENLFNFKEELVADLRGKYCDLSKEEVLTKVFVTVYSCVMAGNNDFARLNYDEGLWYDTKDLFEVCFFSSLCMFVTNTKRINGMSLEKFTYSHSPLRFNEEYVNGKKNKNYFDYDYPDKSSSAYKLFKSVAGTLRQDRHRILKYRPLYDKNPEWSGVRKDTEHGWAFFSVLSNLGPELEKTYDDIGRLYTNINKLFHPPGDGKYVHKLEAAYLKFSHRLGKIDCELFDKLQDVFNSPKDGDWRENPDISYVKRVNAAHEKFFPVLKKIDHKLYNDMSAELSPLNDADFEAGLDKAFKQLLSRVKKIKYVNFLELQKKMLAYLCEDDRYYGMNIYGYESLIKLNKVTNEVKMLLACRNETEERDVLVRAFILDNICFPDMCHAFFRLKNTDDMIDYVDMFIKFKNCIENLSILVLDEFIENGLLGDDWENLFLDTINEMVERVFYNPEKIDFTVTDTKSAQEVFEKLLYSSALFEIEFRRSRLEALTRLECE